MKLEVAYWQTNLQFISFFLLFLITGCSSPDVHFEDQIAQIQAQPLPVQAGDYLGTTWLDANWIAFLYESEFDITLQNVELILYNLNSEEWIEVPFIKPDECGVGRYQTISKISGESLGVTYDCTTFEPYMKIYDSLYDWNMITGEFQLLYTYPSYFGATTFSVSPNGLEIIQEEGGNNPQPSLHHVAQSGEMTQLVPEFFRAGSPSWSPDGEMIAFFANEAGPGEKSSIFTGLVELNNVIDFPWDLHLMDKTSNETQIVLSDIQYATGLKWSPNGKWLAFRGTFQQKHGIYVFDPNTLELVRIWEKRNEFDWSPNSEQIVILNQDEGIKNLHTAFPTIVDVSFLISR